ncbi:hypothetical protein [Campylobacter jejuni]|uniref:hypothetical protein n=1 Tax=Campylobacter jejuni TaxID=197 RepID=UPI00274058E7|nr:hypothetical protein [Campylobacter jejuni]
MISKTSENIKLEEQEFNVDYYIWNEKIRLIGDRQKHMLFFDGSGSLVAKQPSGVDKVDFIDYKQCHTAIIKSQYLSKIQDENFDEQTLIADDVLIKLCKKITLKLKELLRFEYLKTYKVAISDYIERMNVKEKLDDVTDEVYSALLIPFIEKFYSKKIVDDVKTIVARLIKVMINTSSDKYLDNLKYILDLDDEQIKKIDYVNKNIEIIKLVSKYEKYVSKLDFLNQFEKIVYGEKRQYIKERTMLHKVVEKNLWIINEEYETVSKESINSDESIKRIIKTNEFFSSDSIKLDEIVSKENISLDKVPDIFIAFKKDKEIHIVELKRPTVNINRDILREVEDKYTIAFNKLSQEYGEEVSIKAVAISSELKDMTKNKKITDKGYVIQPNTWRNLINDARNILNQKLEKLDKQIKHSKWNEIKEYLRDYGAEV